LNSTKLDKYLPHARAVLSHSEEIPTVARESMTVQLHLADFLYQSNKLGEARKLNRACTKYFKEPMRDDKALVLCLIQRASIEQASKIYDQASIWFRRARD
jgi:hypothetical protein